MSRSPDGKLIHWEMEADDEFPRMMGKLNPAPATPFFEAWDPTSPLSELLNPIGVAKFTSSYFAKNFFHFKAPDRKRFQSLFSYASFAKLISGPVSSANAIAFTADYQRLNQSEISRNVGMQPLLDAGKIARLLRDGGSFSMKMVDNADPSVGKLARDLEDWTHFERVFANLYYTRQGGQTFGWHQDDHDVLVCQIEGQKIWDIYKPHFRFPLPKPEEYIKLGINESNSTHLKRVILKQGDILYIPAGFPHEVRCLPSDDSLHLTFGMDTLQRYELLNRVIQESLNDLLQTPEFRVPIFRTSASSLEGREKKTLGRMLKQVLQNIDTDAIERNYHAHLASRVSPHPLDQLSNLSALISRQNPPANSAIYRTAKFAHLRAINSGVRLTAESRHVKFESRTLKALQFMLHTPVFQMADIPGPLTSAENETLLWALVDKGLLEIPG